MPLLIGLLVRALAWAAVPIAWSVLRGLGFAAVAYTGISAGMDWAKSYVFTSLGAVPAAWLQLLGVLQVDVAINILFSAYIARALLWGMNKSGSKSSIRWAGK